MLSGGLPGNKGGGRPSDEYRAWLNEAKANPNARRVFEAHLQSGNIRFWDHAAKYSETPLPQQHKVDATVTFKAVRE